MANEQNLTYVIKSTEEARALAQKSAEARRKKAERRKTAREFAIAILENRVKDKKTGKNVAIKNMMIEKVVKRAVKDGDLNYVKYILELIGEGPAQKVEISSGLLGNTPVRLDFGFNDKKDDAGKEENSDTDQEDEESTTDESEEDVDD